MYNNLIILRQRLNYHLHTDVINEISGLAVKPDIYTDSNSRQYAVFFT